MKIGITINRSWNIYNFRKGLIEALIAAGHEVVAIAPKDKYSARLEALGCRYEAIEMSNKGSSPIKDIGLIYDLFRVYKKANLDVILHYTIKPNIYGAIAAAFLRIPTINNVSGLGTVFIRHDLTSFIAKLLYKIAFYFPAVVFFQNKDDKTLFLSQGLVREKITDLLPGSGVNITHFSPRPFRRNQVFTFLMIARVLYDKGIIEFIEAIRIIRKKNVEARFKLLGAVEQERNLGAAIEDIRLWEEEGLIEYMGTGDDVRAGISLADCVVLPSYREGTPRSLLEAAAMGKPLITTDVPGCREVVKNNYNGFLCEVKNAEDLADKMLRIIGFDDEQLKQTGIHSRRLAVDVFDEKLVIKKYMAAIHASSKL